MKFYLFVILFFFTFSTSAQTNYSGTINLEITDFGHAQNVKTTILDIDNSNTVFVDTIQDGTLLFSFQTTGISDILQNDEFITLTNIPGYADFNIVTNTISYEQITSDTDLARIVNTSVDVFIDPDMENSFNHTAQMQPYPEFTCELSGAVSIGETQEAGTGLLLRTEVYAQKAEVEVNLANPNGQGVKGQIEITGADTTINDPNFESPKNYVLKNITGIEDNILAENYKTYPNPVNTNLTIEIPANARGRIEAYNIRGSQIAKANIEDGNFIIPSASQEIIFLKYISENGKTRTNKLLTKGKDINAQIDRGFETVEKYETKTKSGLANNDNYNIAFTDPTGNLEKKNWDIYVELGQQYKLNEELLWSLKNIFTQGSTSKNATIIYSANGNELKRITTNDGNIPSTSMSERFDQETGIPVDVSITAENADDINFNQLVYKDGIIDIDTLLNRHYLNKINATSGTGANITITDSLSNPLISGVTGETLTFKARADEQKIIRTVNKEFFDTYKDTIIIVPGLTEKTIGLIGNYDVNANVRNNDGNVNVGIVDQYGNTLSSGNAEETQSFKQAADNIPNAKIIMSAEGAETKEIVTNLTPGANNTSEVINWIYNNYVTGKDGAQVVGTFNGNVVADYVANGSEELKTFVDTLLTGNVNWQQTKDNYVATNQNFTANKGNNTFDLEQMLGKFTREITNAKIGANINWKDEANNTLLSGVDAISLYEELAQDSASVKAIIEMANYLNDTIEFKDAIPGITQKTAGQMIGKYTRNIIGAKDGANIKWEELNGTEILSGINATSLYEELAQDTASVKAIVSS